MTRNRLAEREELRRRLILRGGQMGDTEFSVTRRRYIELGGWWPFALTDWDTERGRELGREITEARGEKA